MGNKTFLVAQREYLENVRTKTFLISIFIVPVLLAASFGISALLKFVVSARKAGNKLFAMNVSPHHQKIFKMVEMSRFMPTIEERDLAAYR